MFFPGGKVLKKATKPPPPAKKAKAEEVVAEDIPLQKSQANENICAPAKVSRYLPRVASFTLSFSDGGWSIGRKRIRSGTVGERPTTDGHADPPTGQHLRLPPLPLPQRQPKSDQVRKHGPPLRDLRPVRQMLLRQSIARQHRQRPTLLRERQERRRRRSVVTKLFE